jgi:4-hydroxy-2-oxoheptanedioate aldolase
VLQHQINNHLKEKLKKGESVLGTWNTLGLPMVTEVLAKSGIDFIIIDFEHGPFQIEKVSDYVNACLNYNCTPIIRIPKNASWMSLQALDQGAHGVMLPGIRNKMDAQYFVNQIKYEPLGSRGFSPFTKSGGFTKSDLQYKEKANELTTTIGIIEDLEGIKNIDKILEVESLDIIYFGAYDLSQDLGFPGDVYNKKLLKVVNPCIQKVLDAKKYAGGFVPQSIDEIKLVQNLGINFLTYNVDSAILHNAMKEITNWFK